MAKSGASASGKAATGVPVAPRGQGRGFKRALPQRKFKQGPSEPDDLAERLRFLRQKKEQVKAAMMLEGKSQKEIDDAMRKIDAELARKQKPKPEDMPEMNDGGGGESSEAETSETPEQKESPKPLLFQPKPDKKGLPQTFWNANARGMRVPPLSPDKGFERRKQQLHRKPSILFMQNARTPAKIGNTSKVPSALTSNGMTGGKAGGNSGPSAGAGSGPSGGSGGPR